MEINIELLLKSYLLCLLVLTVFDVIWLRIMNKRFYKKNLNSLMLDRPIILPALLFYLLYPLGISIFVILPNLNTLNTINFLLSGLLFGLMCYGTYDLTNYATIKNWPRIITIVDIIWGSLLTGVSSLIVGILI